MTNRTKHHDKKPFCQYYLQCFSSSEVLDCHVKYYLAINHTKSVSLPEEGEYVLGLRPATLLKKRLWHRYFHLNFAKFLRTPFLQNTSGGLLLSEQLFGSC